MSTFAVPARPGGIPGRVLGRLLAATVALSAAFFLAPPPLAAISPNGGYADEEAVHDAVGSAFAGYWPTGDATLTPDLQRLVDYWVRFHIFKGAFALVLLIVLATLGVRLWRAFLAAGDRGLGRRVALAAGGTFTAALGLFAVMLVMANIQCTLAPLSSLATFLDAGTTPAGLQAQLQTTVDTGAAASPPLQRLIDDFGYYHAVMAVLGTAAALAFAALSAQQWRRFARAVRPAARARRVFATFATLAALTAVAFALLAFGNTGVAADPAPALLAFFEGGW
ncbi:hypothetical protein [Dactylosporangium sp. NPDC051541]|uniref:hypothetical protein n=1 Tax=Dactylosporangium sp. NPDC051541 TaxID=3363977 RepID=UPI0037B5D0D7